MFSRLLPFESTGLRVYRVRDVFSIPPTPLLAKLLRPNAVDCNTVTHLYRLLQLWMFPGDRNSDDTVYPTN